MQILKRHLWNGGQSHSRVLWEDFGASEEREGEGKLCGLTQGGLVLKVALGEAGASAKGGV